MKKILLFLALVNIAFAASAQWAVDNNGNFSTVHDVTISGALKYTNVANFNLTSAGISANGSIGTNKSLSVGALGSSIVGLEVMKGSFQVHSQAPVPANVDFDLGEVGSRFWFNSYRNIFRGGEIFFSVFKQKRGVFFFFFCFYHQEKG